MLILLWKSRIYSINVYNFIKENCIDDEEIHQLNTDFVNKWRESHNISKSDPLNAQTISIIIGTDDKVKYISDSIFEKLFLVYPKIH